MNINRRNFVTRSTASAAGVFFGNHLKGMPGQTNPVEETFPLSMVKYDLMKDVMKYRKIDAHAHNYLTGKIPG